MKKSTPLRYNSALLPSPTMRTATPTMSLRSPVGAVAISRHDVCKGVHNRDIGLLLAMTGVEQAFYNISKNIPQGIAQEKNL